MIRMIRSTRFLSGVTASLLLAATSLGATSTLASDQAEPAAEERKVCKRIEETGRRTKKRVCYTQRTWDRMREQSQESVRRVRERGDTTRGGGDG